MRAVIQWQGSQYLVQEGQELLLPKLKTPGDFDVTEVLLLMDGNSVQVGQPCLSGCAVHCQYLGEQNGPKLKVLKFKAKSRYKKTIGFRAKFSKVKIVSIRALSSPPPSAVPSPAQKRSKSKSRETKS